MYGCVYACVPTIFLEIHKQMSSISVLFAAQYQSIVCYRGIVIVMLVFLFLFISCSYGEATFIERLVADLQGRVTDYQARTLLLSSSSLYYNIHSNKQNTHMTSCCFVHRHNEQINSIYYIFFFVVV